VRQKDSRSAREKEIKGWDRAKRVALVESENPTWEDLSLEWGKLIGMLNPATAGEQQIPRFARDDNSCSTDSAGAEEKMVTKT
jgi:hypothetical protein